MIFRLFRRSNNEALIERLYAGIVEAARRPALYSHLGMTDTFEGRFESLTLHAALVLRCLNGLPAPGPDMAQDLIDTVFRHFDRTLREMGVGDTTVPKRMKKLAEAFLGRSAAYDEALRYGERTSLAQALARNILGSGVREDDLEEAAEDARLPALTDYVEAAVASLATASVQAFIDGKVPFPEPSLFQPGSAA